MVRTARMVGRPPKKEQIAAMVTALPMVGPDDIIVVASDDFHPSSAKSLLIALANRGWKRGLLVPLRKGDRLETVSREKAREILEAIANA